MAKSDVCVAVHGVSKKFSRSLKRSFVYGARDIAGLIVGRSGDDSLRPSEFWAIRNVSLELRRGQTVGIVGLNGSGKTTLLRMISGILRPTLGHIQVTGQIAPMLALGAGFKPMLSGRENIFLNLSLLGVAERDIRTRYESIVDFAELSEAIEAPIGTYSSGMLARLGFACAIHTNPQILVVDEILSVGDARFRAKCRNRIYEMRRTGTSMLLVSHSATLIESLSDECLFLRKGRVVAQGAPRVVLKAFEEDTITNAISQNVTSSIRTPSRERTSDQVVGVHSVVIRADGATDDGYLLCGCPGKLTVTLECMQEIIDVSVNLMIFDETHQIGETVQLISSGSEDGLLRVLPGQAKIQLSFPEVGLRPGFYRLKVSIAQSNVRRILDVVDNLKLVVRDTGKAANCLFYQSRYWNYSGAEIYSAEGNSFERDQEMGSDV